MSDQKDRERAAPARSKRGVTPARRARTTAVQDEALRLLAESVPSIAAALGSDSEVVLHDLRRIPESIVAVGGKLTGRAAGGPTTDLLLHHLRQGRTQDMLRYQTRPGDGRVFRSSTVFLRDPTGAPFACLCFNTDLTAWREARAVLDEFISTSPIEDEEPDGPESEESFLLSVTELASTMVSQAIAAMGIPVELMQKHHKLGVVRELEAQGLFLVRDAVDFTAKALGVTRFTIYNYLNEIRANPAEGEE